MGFFINNKSSKRVVRRTGGNFFIKYTNTTPKTSIAAMNVGAWGDPHMYIRKPQTLNPNDYSRGVFLAKWDDNKSGASGLNEIRLIDLQTATDTVKIFYTNKAYNTAKVVSSIRVELNGNSTNYTTANTSSSTVTAGPITMKIVRLGSGSSAYLIFEAKWDAINNVVKFKGALTAILKRMASSKTAYIGQAGLTFDGFSAAGQPYGLSRASFETNGVGMLSEDAETLNTGDDLTDALNYNTETSIGSGLDADGQAVTAWDDIAAEGIQAYKDGIVQPELPSGPIFSSVGVDFWTADGNQFTDAYRTFATDGNGTSTLNFTHSFTQVPGGTYGGRTRVYFTLAAAARVNASWQFSGGSYPSNYPSPNIASTSSHPYFNVEKDGIYRMSLGYTYHSTSPALQPMLFDLEAGTYFFEFVINTVSQSALTATLSTKPTYTKTFVGYTNSVVPYRGEGTDSAYIPFIWGAAKYLLWTPNNTTTVIRITANSTNSNSRVAISGGALTSSGRSTLLAAGWSFDSKGYSYSKSISGTMDLTIPPLTNAGYPLQIHDIYDPITATILS